MGFAIGLSPACSSRIRTIFLRRPARSSHRRVVYGDQATSRRHDRSVQSAADITNRVGSNHSRLVRDTGIATYLRVMAHELLASQMIWDCLTAKEVQFEDEREVRGIVMNVRAKFDPWRRTVRAAITSSTSFP